MSISKCCMVRNFGTKPKLHPMPRFSCSKHGTVSFPLKSSGSLKHNVFSSCMATPVNTLTENTLGGENLGKIKLIMLRIAAAPLFQWAMSFVKKHYTGAIIWAFVSVVGPTVLNLIGSVILKFWNPFSEGERITSGSDKDRAIKSTVYSTTMMDENEEEFMVYNSKFFLNGVVNHSRKPYRPMDATIRIRRIDLSKIEKISAGIREMLDEYPDVYKASGIRKPYCNLIRFENAYPELKFGCNLKQMDDYMFAEAKGKILLEVVKVLENLNTDLAKGS